MEVMRPLSDKELALLCELEARRNFCLRKHELETIQPKGPDTWTQEEIQDYLLTSGYRKKAYSQNALTAWLKRHGIQEAGRRNGCKIYFRSDVERAATD